MQLDARTILFTTALMALVLAAYLGATVRAYPPHIRGLRRWSVANVAICGAWIVFALRGMVPESVSIFLGNGLLLWAALGFNNAVASFVGRRFSQRWYVLPPLVGAGLLWFHAAVPSYAARATLVAAVMAALFTRGAWVLGHLQPEQRTLGSRATQLSFLLGAALSIARLLDVSVIRRDQSGSVLEQSSFEASINVAACIGIVILTISFMTMCNERLSGEFRRLATLDPLTEIPNRRALEEAAHREVERARRDGRPVSLLILDLDRFKAINDRLGHEGGDATLRAFVEVVRRQLRSHDHLGRLGGEEFVAILPATTLAEAERIAERARQAVEAYDGSLRGERMRFTTCIGVAELGPAPEAYAAWLARADRALYEAKDAGRNRVVVARAVL